MALTPIPALPDPPIRGTDTGQVFSDKTAALLDALQPWTDDVNDFGATLYAEAQSVISGVASVNGETGILVGYVKTTGAQTLADKTLTLPAIDGTIIEDVYAITDGSSVVIDPTNGSVQTWTLGASRTPTAANFTAGQSVTLMIADGSAYAVTWSSIGVTWAGGSAPALPTSGYAVIELWKVGSTIYGAYVGPVA